MRALVQKVTQASVEVEGREPATIGQGLLVLLGVCKGDTDEDLEYVFNKLINLRALPGDGGTFDKSLLETDKEILIVSQFTLYGDTRKGRRPDFVGAMAADQAKLVYEKFVDRLEKTLPGRVKTGVFQAHMLVHSTNDGPITLWVESPAKPQ